jgi:hypothetical protein
MNKRGRKTNIRRNNKLYASLNIIRVIKYGRMRYGTASNPDRKIPHGISTNRRYGKIKMDFEYKVRGCT